MNVRFQKVASFFNCGRRWGIHFDQLLDLVRGAECVNPGVPKKM